MIAALALGALTLDLWFLGFLVETGRFLPGLICLAAAVIVFPIGRGAIIDGASRKVIRWWGWVHKPVLQRSYDFSAFSSIRIEKKLGPKGQRRNQGRSVRRPLYLVTSAGKRIPLIICLWVDGACGLSEEVAGIMGVQVDDRFPNDEDKVG